MHPIFQGFFHKYAEENKQFEDKLKRVIGELRFQINSKNLDLNNLLEGLGFKERKELSFSQFAEFLRHIHPKMTKEEISFFFEKMDGNADGAISVKELTAEMEKNKINFNRQGEGKKEPLQGSGELLMSGDLHKKVKRCFIRLHNILTSKNLTLYQTFYAYDTDRDGDLTILEF